MTTRQWLGFSNQDRQKIGTWLTSCDACSLYKGKIRGKHIPGVQNPIADAVSRNQMQVFLNLLQAQPQPTNVPPSLLKELTDTKQWTSDTWTAWCRAGTSDPAGTILAVPIFSRLRGVSRHTPRFYNAY